MPEFQISWATGDAALGGFSEIDRATREYLVDGTVDFLNEINKERREIVIFDSVQLEPTSIVALWGKNLAYS